MSNDDILSSGRLSVHIPEGPVTSLDNLDEYQSRSLVFYDEQIQIYIKLQLENNDSSDGNSNSDNKKEKNQQAQESIESDDPDDDEPFGQVAIAVELKVVGSVNNDRDQVKEKSYVTHSEIVTSSQLISKSDTVAIWKLNASLEHPRTRLVHPQVVVDAVLNIGKTGVVEDNSVDTAAQTQTPSYLEPFKPVQEINLFQALGHDSNLSRLQSSLSASRIMLAEKHTPSPSPVPEQIKDDPTKQIEYEKLRKLSAAVTIPVYPALNLRLRTTKASGIHDNVIAILEIGCTELAQVSIDIDLVKVDLLGGSANALGKMDLPQRLAPSETCTVSFNLYHSDVFLLAREQASRVKPVCISVECSPLLGPVHSRPKIQTKWDTVVDFDISNGPPPPPPPPQIPSSAQMPPPPPPSHPSALPSTPSMSQTAPGTPSMRKLMKFSRTNSSASLPAAARVNAGGAAGGGAAAQGAGAANNQAKWTSNSSLSGLTLSFSGPSTVKVGQSFQWKIFAVNRSQSTRHLSLYIQSIDRAFEKSLPRNAELYPVIDRMALKRMYQISSLGSVGLISLNNDIRIGPLYSQSCYETEISLLALSAGVHTLEGVTILDQSNGEMYDCGRLLEVVVNDG